MIDKGNSIESTSYIAMNVKCTYESGLKRCVENLLKSLKEEDVMICLTEDGMFFLFTDVIIPAFTISCPYLDDCGRDQVVLCVYEVKFLFWWKDSVELRNLFGDVQASLKDDYMRTTIRIWSSLR